MAEELTREDMIKGTKSSTATSNPQTATKLKVNLKKCPCKKSDQASWMLDCISCKQGWHSACANIKGKNITGPFITALEDWLCPWCFEPPAPKPETHPKFIREEKIQSIAVSDIVNTVVDNKLENITQSLISDIDTKLKSAIDSGLTATLEKVIGRELEKLQDFKNEILELKHEAEAKNSENEAEAENSENGPSAHDNNILNEHHIVDYGESFLNGNESDELLNYFNQREFVPENGHSVITYGEVYHYTGSKSEPTPFPVEIENIVNKINTKLNLTDEHKINQCLVNKFSGPDSHLNEHSDDEWEINPESCIYTITLGDTRRISFCNKMSGEKHHIDPHNGSLYTMTRRSQNFYSHEIKKDEQFTGIRYSITFRSVDWRFKNSTCLIGDSNTSRLKFGSDPSSTFGQATPGKKEVAYTNDEIDPFCTVGYRNIVLLCGVNNLKLGSVQKQRDIDIIYKKYLLKVETIQRFNPRANIFICPLLPTKSRELNEKVVFFNRLIFNNMVQCIFGITIIEGISNFLGANRTLSAEYAMPQLWDTLHINNKGVKQLAMCIKTSIFHRKRRRGSSGQQNNRDYANAVKLGSQRP